MHNPDNNNKIKYGLLKKYRYKEEKLLEGLESDRAKKLVRAYIYLAADVFKFIKNNEKLDPQREKYLKKLLPTLSKIVTATFYNSPAWLKENVHNLNAQGLSIVHLLVQYKLYNDTEKNKAVKIKEKLDIIRQPSPKPQLPKSQQEAKQKGYLNYLAWGVGGMGVTITLALVSFKIASVIAPRETEKTMRHGASAATEFFSPMIKKVVVGTLSLGAAGATGKYYLDTQEQAENQKFIEELVGLIKEIDADFDLNKPLTENSSYQELKKFLDSIPDDDVEIPNETNSLTM